MQQLFTTEDTESTEKCQRILINWGRATGSPVQSDGFPDFSLMVGFTESAEKCQKDPCVCGRFGETPLQRNILEDFA